MNTRHNIFTRPISTDQNSLTFGYYFTLLFIIYLMPFWNLHEYLSSIPSYFYTPNKYSIAYYLINDIPSRPFLIIWQLLNIGLFYLLLTLNYRNKVLCSILLTASLTLYFALYYSFGKIDHSYANIIFIPFACMALSSENKWAFNTVVFILMFSFLSAGLFKLLDPTYISYDTHKVFNMIGNKEFNSWFNALDIGGPLKIFIKESFDWATLIFEVVLAVIVLLNYRHIFLYITIACVFHCLINYLLGIPFGGQRLVYIYITLVFLYRHIPWLASILHNLEKLLKNKYFWLILAISYLGHTGAMIKSARISLLHGPFKFYFIYIVIGAFNMYLYLKWRRTN